MDLLADGFDVVFDLVDFDAEAFEDVDFDALALPLLAFELPLLDFDVLECAALLLLLRVECFRALRSGRFQSTALSARKLAGMTIGPSA